jgi:hypothetical protein
MARGTLAFHRHWLAVPHQYPVGWNDAHISVLEQIRVAIGLALHADVGGVIYCVTWNTKQRAVRSLAGSADNYAPAFDKRLASTGHTD